MRLRVLDDAGRQAVPFTTGILVGIGETPAERVESILAIRTVARAATGTCRRCIVQNFRAKPDTAMRHEDDLELMEYVATLAVARVLLGPRISLQAPPNLSDPAELALLLRAGVDDWGGVSPLTPDHVNPERPWPNVEDLASLTAASGFELRERLTAHPRYVRREDPWLDPRVRPHVRALAGPDGLADPDAVPVGLAWQASDDDHALAYDSFAATSSGRTDLHESIDTAGRTADRRSDFDEVYGDWAEVGAQADRVDRSAPVRLDADERAGLALAADDPAALAADANLAAALALFHSDGPALDALARIADDVRRDTVGDDVTYVVNRNINFTNVCYTGCRFCAFAQRRTDADAYTLSRTEFGDRVDEAWMTGATEVCVQGGIHPDLPGTAYFDLLRETKSRRPGMHFHGFSPMEIVNGATRSGMSVRDWLVEAKAAGLDSVPGTAAEILDDEVRWILTKGKLPTASWIDVITTAHSVGLPSSSTMMYGHVDAPRHWLAHLRAAAPAAAADRRLHRVRRAPVHPPQRAGLPRRSRPARSHPPRQPGRARHGPAAAARRHRQHPDLLGQARHRRRPGDARLRRERPRRHADGGDHQPDGRLGERVAPVHRRPGGDGGGRRPARPAAHHRVRAGQRGASGGRAAGRVAHPAGGQGLT